MANLWHNCDVPKFFTKKKEKMSQGRNCEYAKKYYICASLLRTV